MYQVDKHSTDCISVMMPLVVTSCWVGMDMSFCQDHFPAPPTLRHQLPSLSIVDEFNILLETRDHSYLPIRDSAVPPGHPTVDKAGPLLPALETNITLCLFTSSFISSRIRLKQKRHQA